MKPCANRRWKLSSSACVRAAPVFAAVSFKPFMCGNGRSSRFFAIVGLVNCDSVDMC